MSTSLPRVSLPPQRGIVFLDGKGENRQVASYRDEEQPVEIPEAWTAQVLLVAGLSPVVANAAALCKAARAARRRGTVVVVDVSARWHLWAGRDPRAVNMQMREADVVHASGEDLAALDLDEARLRDLVRPTTVLVISRATGEARATGPFGAVDRRSRADVWTPSTLVPEAFPVAICAMLARTGDPTDHSVDAWAAVLADGLAGRAPRAARPALVGARSRPT